MKIISVVGARPNFMKIAPFIKEVSKHSYIHHKLIHTGQHYDSLLSGVFFDDLNIKQPDYNLGIGGVGKKHYHQQAELGIKIIELFESKQIKPDIVLFFAMVLI